MTKPLSGTNDQIRIDKWLWYTRQTKTRSLAQKLVASGSVRVNREKTKSASKMIGPEDVLTFTISETVKILKVVECGSRRGPFAQAKLLYEDLSPPIVKVPYLSNAQKGIPTAHGKPEPRARIIARRLSGKE